MISLLLMIALTVDGPNYRAEIVGEAPPIPAWSDSSPEGTIAALANRGNPFWSRLREMQDEVRWFGVEIYPDDEADTLRWTSWVFYDERDVGVEPLEVMFPTGCKQGYVGCRPVDPRVGPVPFRTIQSPSVRGDRVRGYVGLPRATKKIERVKIGGF